MSKTSNYYNRIQVYLSDEIANLFSKYCEEHDLSASKGAKRIISNFFLPNNNTTATERNSESISESIFESRLKRITESIDNLFYEIGQHDNMLSHLEKDLNALKNQTEYTTSIKATTNSVNKPNNPSSTNSNTELVLNSVEKECTESNTELATESEKKKQKKSKSKVIKSEKPKQSKSTIKENQTSTSDKIIKSLGYLETNDPKKNNLLSNEQSLETHHLQGIAFDKIAEDFLLKARILWNLDYGKNHPFVIGGKKKTIRTDNLLLCRFYSTSNRAQAGKDKFDKEFNCIFEITHALNLLNRLEPKDKLRLLKYWKKDNLFKKQ